MARSTLTHRVERLEHTAGELVTLPQRVTGVERELAALRLELRTAIEPLATRGELRAITEPLVTRDELCAITDTLVTRDELRAITDTLVTRDEFRAVTDALVTRDEFHAVTEPLVTRDELRATTDALAAQLRAEIREGDEETRRYMRVLHEDLIDRIKTLGEAIDGLRDE